MADDKGSQETFDILEFVVILILIFFFYKQVTSGFLGELIGDFSVDGATSFFARLRDWIAPILQVITALSMAGIIYVLFKFARIRKRRIAELMSVTTARGADDETAWKKIVDLANSRNPSDWKVAIIQADTVLDEIVTRMGYSGDTLGEKLKNIEKSDFRTLDDAWEAHKFRNRIAHEYEDVPRREVRRVLALYENVFREFEYI